MANRFIKMRGKFIWFLEKAFSIKDVLCLKQPVGSEFKNGST
jgi:hypothetical protein